MGEIAISIQNISKCFKRYRHPADRLKEIFFPGQTRSDQFWAIQNLNLEIPKGITLGIVGRNGSGKSTLLQIIVGTLAPTSGNIRVNGRISALLELGSGFNPEFTGRQNVFFNGQLLGLTQAEIEDKFDEIAAFADIGDFIDQPVKTYSSGMFVRLAFAVATSVEPDILVVDEALSVGDEAFQRKCFARIESIQERGGTILFVSHSASTVVELCDSAVLMDAGELLLYHKPKLVLDKYYKLIYAPAEQLPQVRSEIRALNQEPTRKVQHQEPPGMSVPNLPQYPVSEKQQIRAFYDPNLKPADSVSYLSRGAKISQPELVTVRGERVNNIIGRHEYVYTYSVEFLEPAYKVRFGMLVKTISGFELGGASHAYADGYIEAGTVVKLSFRFKCMLHPGVYFLNAGVSGLVDGNWTYLDRCIDAAMFRVMPEAEESPGTGTVDLAVKPTLTVESAIPIRVESAIATTVEISTNSLRPH
ncbi:MAG TPA: ABC transporter ATP-binding protein [Oscillatoriaceae cyanobacterium M33_DOE_052]|uniref:ABC transporter ATP-binding protein n=1 Tax=Planktothricoides sp. SpSt-374 TaxID=2282167 RepID=A0A7C3VH49_9CYAN|nr:ABC transporter ATP-binding protein [Oscillatoriaceae cyanobacterium M33_DOE_052]